MVGYVSRFMEVLTTTHLAAVKHLLRYVVGTRKYGCSYVSGDDGVLVGYNNSDMVGDVDDWKSTSGILFLLGRTMVTW